MPHSVSNSQQVGIPYLGLHIGLAEMGPAVGAAGADGTGRTGGTQRASGAGGSVFQQQVAEGVEEGLLQAYISQQLNSGLGLWGSLPFSFPFLLLLLLPPQRLHVSSPSPFVTRAQHLHKVHLQLHGMVAIVLLP